MFRTLTVFLHSDECSFATAEFLTYEAANLWRKKIIVINYHNKFKIIELKGDRYQSLNKKQVKRCNLTKIPTSLPFISTRTMASSSLPPSSRRNNSTPFRSVMLQKILCRNKLEKGKLHSVN